MTHAWPLAHGGALTWDELALVVALYVLLGLVVLAGRRSRAGDGVDESSSNDIDAYGGAAIVVDDVSFRRGRDWTIRNVDLQVEPASFVVIAGANGAGKTTLLGLIAGREVPSAGTILIGGINPHLTPDLAAALVGVVDHQSLLYPRLTVRENLEYFAALHGLDDERRRIARALALVQLRDRADSRVDRLSHGQRQRASLARAILHGPRVLLLDEPFSGLDLSGADGLEHLLGQLRDAGITVVMTTHDLERAVALADRVLVVAEKTIAADIDCAAFGPVATKVRCREILIGSAGAQTPAPAIPVGST